MTLNINSGGQGPFFFITITKQIQNLITILRRLTFIWSFEVIHVKWVWVSEVNFTEIYRQFNYLGDEVLRSAGCWTTLTWCGSDWVGIRFDGFWVSRELRLSLCSSQRLPDQRCSNHQLWMERENHHDILLNDREAVISHLQDISVITDDNHFLINNFTYS